MALDTGRLVHEIKGHEEDKSPNVYIADVAWSPDGERLATASLAGGIKIWDFKSAKLILHVCETSGSPTCSSLSWSPSARLASGHARGLIRVWDSDSAEEVWRKQVGHRHTFLQWNPSGSRLAAFSDQLNVVSAEGKHEGLFPGKDLAFVWIGDDEVVFGGIEQEIWVGDTRTFEAKGPLRVHAGRIVSLAKIDNSWILSSSLNGSLCRFRSTMKTNDLQMTDTHHGSPSGGLWRDAKRLDWGPSSRRILTTGPDGRIVIWKADTLEQIRELKDPKEQGAADVVWRRRDNRILSIHGSRLLQWNPDSGELLADTPIDGRGPLSINGINNQVAYSATYATCRLLDSATGATLWTKSGPPFRSIAFSPRGRFVGRAGYHGGVEILDADSGQQRLYDAKDRRSPARGSGLAWNPTGTLLDAGSGTVRIYDARNAKLLTTLKGHRGRIHGIDFNPSNTRLASVDSQNQLLIWDASTGDLLMRVPIDDKTELMKVKWSPDGRRLAITTIGGNLWVLGSDDVEVPRPKVDALTDGVLRSVKGVDAQLAELNQEVARNPDDAELRRKRGEWLAGQLRWRKALEDFEKASELRPNFTWERLLAARAALMAGEKVAYQRHVDFALGKLAERRKLDPGVTGEFLATTVALSPEENADLEWLLKLSKAHSEAKGEVLWASQGVLLLHLRLGRTEELLRLLQDYKNKTSPNYRIFLEALRALAHEQRGDSAAAKRALRAAQSRAAKAWFEPAEDEPIPYADTGIFVEAKSLLDEASRTIQAGARRASNESGRWSPARRPTSLH